MTTVNFKSLNWKIDERTLRGDGKYNTEKATVEIQLPNGDWKIFRSYSLHRGASVETDNIWNLLILDGNYSKHINVGTLDNGKQITEEDYREYMHNLFNGMTQYILSSDSINNVDDDNKYCEVITEHFGIKREYEITRCSTLEEAITKAMEFSDKIKKVFHSQDRVFVKVGNLYYNPNKLFSNGIGVSWI